MSRKKFLTTDYNSNRYVTKSKRYSADKNTPTNVSPCLIYGTCVPNTTHYTECCRKSYTVTDKGTLPIGDLKSQDMVRVTITFT